MSPFIRINEDAVKVVPCRVKDVRIGDVILIKTNNTDAKVLLHRLYKI